MQTREREKESVNDFKTHAEIEELFNELKELEERYSEYKDIKPDTKDELIDVGHEEEIINPLPIQKEKTEIKNIIEKAEKKAKFNLKSRLKKFSPKENTQKIRKESQPATFRLRLNEEGKLQNIDFKKPKMVVKRKLKFSIKNRKKREKKLESTEEESRFGKIKGAIGRIGKLKRVIPSKSSNDEEETETTEEPEF